MKEMVAFLISTIIWMCVGYLHIFIYLMTKAMKNEDIYRDVMNGEIIKNFTRNIYGVSKTVDEVNKEQGILDKIWTWIVWPSALNTFKVFLDENY